MYSRKGWLIVATFFWGFQAWDLWDLGPTALLFVAVGAPIGWACAVYLMIPYQYRYMVEQRQGRRQGDLRGWKIQIMLTVAGLIVFGIMDELTKSQQRGIASIVGAGLATAFTVAAFSKKLASAAKQSTSWSSTSEYDSSKAQSRSDESRRRRGRRHRKD